MRALVIGAVIISVGCSRSATLLTSRDGGGDDATAGSAGGSGRGGTGGGSGGKAGTGSGGGSAGASGGGPAGASGGGGRGGIAGTGTAGGAPAGRGGSTGVAGAGGTEPMPLSTGTFPYPGRWWGRLTTPERAGAFVIHWSATDPVDRALWTRAHTYALDVTPGPEGGTTMTSAAPEMKGCWTLYATADPDELRVQPCNMPPSSGQAALGFFRRGARLINPIPLPPVGAPATNPRVLTARFGGNGQWFLASVDGRLALWKNDAGRSFDLGEGNTTAVDFSPDGRRVVYFRSINGKGALIAYDSTTGTERQVTPDAGWSSTGILYFTGLFSHDGRRFAFFERPNFGSTSADIAVYDFDTDAAVTVATRIHPGLLPADVMFLGGSSRIVFAAYDATMPFSSGTVPFYGHDFTTGVTRSFGDAVELIGIPGGAFVAFRNYAGEATLIDGASFTPRVLSNLNRGPTFVTAYAGFQPSADGKRLAYVDGDRVLHVVGLDGSPELTVGNNGGCHPDYGSFERSHDQLPNPPRAALFTRDGRAIVHVVDSYCDRSPFVTAFARYDLVTGLETVLSLPLGSGDVFAVSPAGQFVTRGLGQAPLLVSWPGPVVELELPVENHDNPTNPTFSFTADGRYLTYTIRGFLMLRDIAAGTTRKLAPIYAAGDPAVTSEDTAISVVWYEHSVGVEGLTAFMPDGSSRLLHPGQSTSLADPRGTVIAFTFRDQAGDGTIFYRMQPTATPQMIGNGYVLAVSATQVIFRDLDGICSLSL
jgi:hypothetical protein